MPLDETCESGRSHERRSAFIVLAATIFLSSFLLFEVQPVLGRLLLPRFGGGTEVWTASLLFFELLLVAGYAYAHWLTSCLDVPQQGRVHLGVIAVSLLFLRLNPRMDLPAVAEWAPALQIIVILAAAAGIPYATLSATSVLLPHWWVQRFEGNAPYRFYALSNLASFTALLSYPFLVEPVLRLNLQVRIWSAMYLVFAAGCGWCAWKVRSSLSRPMAQVQLAARPPAAMILFWLALAACGSTLMLATTRQLSQEVAVVPFLWVLPLAIYLLTFVLCFDRELWYRRSLFALAALVLAPWGAKIQAMPPNAKVWPGHLAVYALTLFVMCMICHGELARSKPPVQRLTLFYLTIAAGGALGGAFVALAAEHLFDFYAEYPLGLGAACLLAIVGCAANLAAGKMRFETAASLAVLVIAVLLLSATASSPTKLAIVAWRNFYGLIQVTKRMDLHGQVRVLKNGVISHGFQYMTAGMRRMPTSYYGPHSGAGIAITAYELPRRRIGVIGLGAGTLAAYGRPGDSFRFYEINPAVKTVASGWFSFLHDSAAATEVVVGDARVSLQNELKDRPQGFDILVVDAFTSDAIPIHLLTSECADLYRRHLKPNGALLLHISNQLLDLQPVARGIARHLGWRAVLMRTNYDIGTGEDASDWVLITSNTALLDCPAIQRAAAKWDDGDGPLLWTDDFASLWHVVRPRMPSLPRH